MCLADTLRESTWMRRHEPHVQGRGNDVSHVDLRDVGKNAEVGVVINMPSGLCYADFAL